MAPPTVPRWSLRGVWDHCEALPEYNESGLCPIVIGDVLRGNDLAHDGTLCSFNVIGKLGRGAYSTVWLGEDTHSGRFLALKVLRQEGSTSESDNHEIHALRKLGKLEAAFLHTPSQSRNHQRYNAYYDPPGDLRSITTFVKTLLENVIALHEKGICHGDISPGNVALGVREDAFTPEALNVTFGEDNRSYVDYVPASDGEGSPIRPAYLPEYIISHKNPLRSDANDMSRVDILDFGKSFDTPSKKNVCGTPFYNAPEADPDGENVATAKSDLWSLGCVDPDYKGYPQWDYETQVEALESHINMNICLEKNPEYMRILAKLIQSLVRVDPESRDPEEAKIILQQLEDYRSSTREQDDAE